MAYQTDEELHRWAQGAFRPAKMRGSMRRLAPEGTRARGLQPEPENAGASWQPLTRFEQYAPLVFGGVAFAAAVGYWWWTRHSDGNARGDELGEALGAGDDYLSGTDALCAV